ncbi:AAA family ATPase [Halomonas chromatireducens]|uniref:Aerobic cobaltochelatase subunit CobS n=1 Tax=Halomonas chromatireducens TaxID=507626 RepID=A0A120JVV6_9GAMM|nr:AAA family ATPase [Halomonas chromatireducens]AMD00397.1 Aerobic cobaltochelatase subunit CobS [Halomonas chromatireducens]
MTDAISSPDTFCDTAHTFKLPLPWPVPAFSEPEEHVPDPDPAFRFMPDVTTAILMGFAHNRRVYLHGPHGSGKSSHIEQVAARLNWPCIRINLDGHITRADLIGRDMVVIRDGKQVTEFVPGILVWALERPVAIVFDEYDAGRPDVMFVIQRLLESQGRLTLLDQNRVITPHPAFRLFATANTAGQGDATGLYAGTQALNQAQMDRWHVVTELGYMPADREREILQSRLPSLDAETIERMVTFAGLTRQAFTQGDLSSLLSLRTLVSWGENIGLIKDTQDALRLAFVNRCDETERPLVAELYQRCFDAELLRGAPHVTGIY